MTKRPIVPLVLTLPMLFVVWRLVLWASDAGDDSGRNVPTAVTGPSASELSVSEAIESDAEGPLKVAGHLIVEDGTARLCDLTFTSLPPVCGEPNLVLVDFDVDDVEGLRYADGVAFSDQMVSVVGHVAGGVVTPA